MRNLFLIVDAYANDGSMSELAIRKDDISMFMQNGTDIDYVPEDRTILSMTGIKDLSIAIDVPYEEFKKAFYCVSLKKEEEN